MAKKAKIINTLFGQENISQAPKKTVSSKKESDESSLYNPSLKGNSSISALNNDWQNFGDYIKNWRGNRIK